MQSGFATLIGAARRIYYKSVIGGCPVREAAELSPKLEPGWRVKLAAIKLCDLAGSERWYLVRTKQHKETLVELRLAEFARRTFLPRMRIRRARPGAVTEMIAPLFPCYLFALFDLESSLYKVLHTIGVAGVVCAGAIPSEVDPSIIEEISRRGENGIIELPQRIFNAGEHVRVAEGPMEGFTGIFDHYRSGAKRVALLLNAVGATMKVVVPADSVVTANAGEEWQTAI